jgi:uncharacterized surface protein with fasciclin (FAS1) repeats
MSKKTLVIIAAAISAALLVAACSSDDNTDSAASPQAVQTESMAPEAADTSSMTIAEIAASNPDFSTLMTAVSAAGLGETLAGEGPFTVFAPTNDAFAALPAGTVEKLLKPANKDQLAAILTYHVVPATVMAADVTSGEVKTVNGATFDVKADDMGVTITDGQGNTANVVQTDIVASNGVIHVIDAVLLPPSN